MGWIDDTLGDKEVNEEINYRLFFFKKYFTTGNRPFPLWKWRGDDEVHHPCGYIQQEVAVEWPSSRWTCHLSQRHLQSQRQMQIVSLMATHHPRYFRHASSYATTTNKFGLPLEWDTSNTLFLIRSPAYESRFHIEWLIIWSSSPIESNSFSRLSELSFLLCVCLSLSLDEFTLHFD